MVTDIVDQCPECKGLDVVDSHGNSHAKYQRPQYFCYSCGARFDNPYQYDKVMEERV